MKYWDCFIAYPRPQLDVAERLADFLAPNIRVFLDCREIQPGDDWPLVTEEALDAARIIVVVVAPETEVAYYEREEIARAIARARTPGSNRRVVPVFIGGVTPNDHHIPYGLRIKQGFVIEKQDDLVRAADAITKLAVETADTVEFETGPLALSMAFSPTIRESLAKMRIEVEQLTKEQFRVIQHLRYMRRVRISGCAGSGKTLVAVEKASRLANAGLRVLFLCHNPLLAERIHILTAGSGVEVRHFVQWIGELVDLKRPQESFAWSHFVEPDRTELEQAFERVSSGESNYDAIIVDEGQDFRDEWWTTVEAGLISNEKSCFYIFHDNNQSLLPHRGIYPINEPHIDLSRNCRNAGKIFDLMRCFDNTAPESDVRLRSLGRVQLKQYEVGRESLVLGETLASFDSDGLLNDVVIIVTTHRSLIFLRPVGINRWVWVWAHDRWFRERASSLKAVSDQVATG